MNSLEMISALMSEDIGTSIARRLKQNLSYEEWLRQARITNEKHEQLKVINGLIIEYAIQTSPTMSDEQIESIRRMVQ